MRADAFISLFAVSKTNKNNSIELARTAYMPVARAQEYMIAASYNFVDDENKIIKTREDYGLWLCQSIVNTSCSYQVGMPIQLTLTCARLISPDGIHDFLSDYYKDRTIPNYLEIQNICGELYWKML